MQFASIAIRRSNMTLRVSLFVAFCISAASPVWAQSYVALGTDYFQTEPGTQFNFGGPIGIVDFLGKPVGPGDTDTEIQRLQDALINPTGSLTPTSINIQMLTLNLKSTAPVNVGGATYNVFVTLDPTKLAQDTGTMTIFGTPAGGTFTDSLTVNFQAAFVPTNVADPAIPDVDESLMLTNSGANWGPTPLPGAEIVNGVDVDGAVPIINPTPAQIQADMLANKHSNLPANYVDFFVNANLTEVHPGGGADHKVTDSDINTPEPSPVSLFAIGSAVLGLSLLRPRRIARGTA